MRCAYGALFLASCLLGAAVAQGPAPGPQTGPAQTPNTAFSANNAPVVGAGGWREGRATFYDAPDYFTQVGLHYMCTSTLILTASHEYSNS